MEENRKESYTNRGLNRTTSKRGFASMDSEQHKQIASKGGKAAHQRGVAHKFSPDEARAAGRKGGESVSQNREYMAEIGRRGGEASRRGRAKSGNNENESKRFDEDLQIERDEDQLSRA